jgi:hypothetical protein
LYQGARCRQSRRGGLPAVVRLSGFVVLIQVRFTVDPTRNPVRCSANSVTPPLMRQPATVPAAHSHRRSALAGRSMGAATTELWRLKTGKGDFILDKAAGKADHALRGLNPIPCAFPHSLPDSTWIVLPVLSGGRRAIQRSDSGFFKRISTRNCRRHSVACLSHHSCVKEGFGCSFLLEKSGNQ